jgi:hypothetical protein
MYILTVNKYKLSKEWIFDCYNLDIDSYKTYHLFFKLKSC